MSREGARRLEEIAFDVEKPEEGFRVLLADPPWSFITRSDRGKGRSPDKHYSTMTLAEIGDMPVRFLMARDAHCFLWTTGPHLPMAFDIMQAWGFRYSGMGFVWVKLRARERDAIFLTDDSFHMGMGYTTRKNAEFCLLGRRGQPKRLRKDVRELIVSARRQHSRKPDEVYRRIEAYCDGPRLELFGRQQRPGWTVWGNETDKFKEAA